jgi:hypothetical protein
VTRAPMRRHLFVYSRWSRQWLVKSLNSTMMMVIASANSTTPITTDQTSYSVGYARNDFWVVRTGGSRRIRDGRGAGLSSTDSFLRSGISDS